MCSQYYVTWLQLQRLKSSSNPTTQPLYLQFHVDLDHQNKLHVALFRNQPGLKVRNLVFWGLRTTTRDLSSKLYQFRPLLKWTVSALLNRLKLSDLLCLTINSSCILWIHEVTYESCFRRMTILNTLPWWSASLAQYRLPWSRWQSMFINLIC